MAKNKRLSKRVESEQESDEANYLDSPQSQTRSSPIQTPEVRQRQRSNKTQQYDDERAQVARKASQPRKQKPTDLSTEEMLAIIAERQKASQRGEDLTLREVRERRQSNQGHQEPAAPIVSPHRRDEVSERPAGVTERHSTTLRLNNTPKRKTAQAENEDIASFYNAQQANKEAGRTKAITPRRSGTAAPGSPRPRNYTPGGRLHSMVLNLRKQGPKSPGYIRKSPMREASITPRQHHRTQQRTPPLTSPRDDDPRHASADDEDSERGSAVGTPRRAKRIRTPGSKRGSPSPRKKTSLRRRRSKPKQADYTGDAQLALIRACRGFKVRTGTEGVFFNDTNTPKAIAMESWREANVHYGLNYKIDANIIKIISDRASQLRGAAKTSGDSKFADLYGFRDGTLDEDIAFNKALVIKLQTKDGYTWITAPTPDTPGSGNGLYKHKLIGRIIIDVFFSGHRDKRLAEIFPTPFNPIPLPTIALACTAIAACVDEWATGQYIKREFKADVYKDVFERHMKRLNDFKKNRRDRLADIQRSLYELGSTHAGINADVAQVIDELTEADYALDD